MLIYLKKPVTNACYGKQNVVLICNRFHTIRANIGKISSFRGYPYLTPSFKGNPVTEGREKLESFQQSTVKIS